LSAAREVYDEMLRAYERGSWNIVVRRAQEAVELSLKGLLKMMVVEYPKSHDVGGIFGRACVAKSLKITPEQLDEVKRISSNLAEARSPAFYMETILAHVGLKVKDGIIRLLRKSGVALLRLCAHSKMAT